MALIRQLRDAGLRIDAIGMQSHNGMNYPDIHEYEQTIQAIIATGVKVQFTELDFNVLPMPWNVQGADVNQRGENSSKMNPYPNKPAGGCAEATGRPHHGFLPVVQEI